ncbi:hypothetical protein [Bacillus cereus]|uniref:SdpC family antimicrobial peptide n=1 Tax=Bacillus cereus VD048 TaxID=1053226 RepID=J8HG42_BACCE|nr:hypothetical protein [Bacillus cereus]EJR26673.1 SdpC family antimicrobial peptide [Bacillus cereus VD048]
MKITKKCVPLAIAATCLFSISTLGSLNVNQVKADEQKQQLSKYTSDDIFKGVFFGVGKFGEKIYSDSQINSNNNDKEKKLVKVVEDITEYVKEENPNYLKELSAAIHEENPNKIDEQLQKSGEILYKALYEPNSNLDLKDFKDSYISPQGAGFEIIAVVWKSYQKTVERSSEKLDQKTAMRYAERDTLKLDNKFNKEQLIHNVITALKN